MPYLQDLPDKLLSEVVTNIQSHRDVAAFSQLCRKFHGLCDLSTRRQYRRVRLQSDEDCDQALAMLLSMHPSMRMSVSNGESKSGREYPSDIYMKQATVGGCPQVALRRVGGIAPVTIGAMDLELSSIKGIDVRAHSRNPPSSQGNAGEDGAEGCRVLKTARKISDSCRGKRELATPTFRATSCCLRWSMASQMMEYPPAPNLSTMRYRSCKTSPSSTGW